LKESISTLFQILTESNDKCTIFLSSYCLFSDENDVHSKFIKDVAIAQGALSIFTSNMPTISHPAGDDITLLSELGSGIKTPEEENFAISQVINSCNKDMERRKRLLAAGVLPILWKLVRRSHIKLEVQINFRHEFSTFHNMLELAPNGRIQ